MAINRKSLSKLTHKDILLLIFIVTVSVVLRLYKLDAPLADWHSWRQADTASVSRNLARERFDLLHPRFDDLSNIPSGQYNPQGFRFVEFPFYNSISALLYKAYPSIALEVYARVTTIIFSVALLLSLFYLTYNFEGKIAAFFTALLMATLPFSIYYSRTILPDLPSVSLMFAGIVALHKWSTVKNNNLISRAWYTSSVIFAALALLVKPTVAFYFIIPLYLFFARFGLRLFEKLSVYAYFIFSFIPFALWRIWMLQYPEGIPAAKWLITTVMTFEGPREIFMRPAFFRWIFYERLGVLILGVYGISLLFFGLLHSKRSLFSLIVALCALIYLLVFQGGNVQHDYYQVMVIPAIVLLAGIGSSVMATANTSLPNRLLNIITLGFILIFSIGFSAYRIKDYYNVSQQLLSIANVIKTITPENALVATDRDGDTTLLYLADRKGFPALTGDLTDMRGHGIQYVVTTKSEKVEEYKNQAELVFENEEVFLFKL